VRRGLLRLGMIVVALAAAACSDDQGTGPGEGMARLRVVHAAAELAEIDVVVDDIELASDLSYLDASEYLELEAGTRSVAFLTDEGTVDSIRVALAEGADYTVLPCCSGFAGSLFLADDNSPSSEGNAKVRVIHFASAPPLDVYLTAPDVDIELETPTLVALRNSDVSEYVQVPTDDYQIRLTNAGTKTVVVDGGTASLSPGQVRTAIAVDAPEGGEPFSVLALEDAN
jgi:hypothetical protein